MKIYIIVAWIDKDTETHPAIISQTTKKNAIETARRYEDFYRRYPNREILIRCDEGNMSQFINWRED